MDSVVVFVTRFLVMKNAAGVGLPSCLFLDLIRNVFLIFSLGKVNNPLFFSLFLFYGAFP